MSMLPELLESLKEGPKIMENTQQPDRDRINQLQRERRKRFIRIDYIDVSPEASQIIDSLRDNSVSGTVSAILNRIVVEWGKKNGRTLHTRQARSYRDEGRDR